MDELDELLRTAVHSQIALWEAMRAVERRLGGDLDGFAEQLDQFCIGVDDPETVDLASLRTGLVALAEIIELSEQR